MYPILLIRKPYFLSFGNYRNLFLPTTPKFEKTKKHESLLSSDFIEGYKATTLATTKSCSCAAWAFAVPLS